MAGCLRLSAPARNARPGFKSWSMQRFCLSVMEANFFIIEKINRKIIVRKDTYFSCWNYTAYAKNLGYNSADIIWYNIFL